MSEEKKTVELKEKELEKASGGYDIKTVYSFKEGDCFSDNVHIYKVLHNYQKMDEKDLVECKWFVKNIWIKSHNRKIACDKQHVRVSSLIECNYEGVDFI